MGVSQAELDGFLMHCSFPEVSFTDESFYDDACRMVDKLKVDLVIWDSLRNLTPGIEENSSQIRDPLKKLARVSKATGAANVFLAHSNKRSTGTQFDARTALRGSSAIFDECAIVLGIQGQKGEPKTIVHDKERNLGETFPDYAVDIVDLANNGDPKWGLRIEQATGEPISTTTQTKKQDDVRLLIVAKIVEHGGFFKGNQLELGRAIKRGNDAVSKYVKELINEGTIRKHNGGFQQITDAGRNG
jgi:AAA domain-containing protein